MKVTEAKRVYLCGNGGSAANATHIANDLISCGIKAYSLTADVATLTAIANDHSYEEVFSRLIEVYGEKGDMLICLSGSGSSKNIVNAIRKAKEKGVHTTSVFGNFNKPNACHDSDITYFFGEDMQEAEDFQLKWGHHIMREVRGNRPR